MSNAESRCCRILIGMNFHFFVQRILLLFHNLKSPHWNLSWHKLLPCFQCFQPLLTRKGQTFKTGTPEATYLNPTFCNCHFSLKMPHFLVVLLDFLYKYHVSLVPLSKGVWRLRNIQHFKIFWQHLSGKKIPLKKKRQQFSLIFLKIITE